MEPLAPGIRARLDALAAVGADANAITRLSLTPEQAPPNALVMGWMREAGLARCACRAGRATTARR